MSGTAIRTFTNQKLEPLKDKANAKELAIRYVVSKTYPMGARLKESATRGLYDLWDGTGNWQLLNSYALNVDASGNITFSSDSAQVGDEHGGFEYNSVGYYNGLFDTKDLPGFNTAALTGAPAGTRLLSGTVTDGVIYIP